jgi:hypothetical protein
MKQRNMRSACQYVKGHPRKGSKPARRGYCKSRPMADAEVDKTIGELFAGEIEAGKKGRRHSKGSHAKAVARAQALCVKASGSTSQIRQRIKAAKKSKSAIKKRCSRKIDVLEIYIFDRSLL